MATVISPWSLVLLCGNFIFAAFSDLVNVTASRGERVNLKCNTSQTKITQLNWARSKYKFAYYNGKNISNFTEHFQITLQSLIVLDFQENDTGIYTCVLNHKNGEEVTIFNLTLRQTKVHAAVGMSSAHVLIISILAISGGLLFIIASAVVVGCCRLWRSSNQTPSQTVAQTRAEGPPPDGAVDQYLERINVIYNL